MKRSEKMDNLNFGSEIQELAGKAKKKLLVVNTATTPTVVNSDGQTVAGQARAYVAANDPVVKGAIEVGLIRVLSE